MYIPHKGVDDHRVFAGLLPAGGELVSGFAPVGEATSVATDVGVALGDHGVIGHLAGHAGNIGAVDDDVTVLVPR